MFQPPTNVTVNDVWIAGLILACLVEIEAGIIVILIFKIVNAKNTTNGHKNTKNNRGKPTNLPE